MLEREVPDGEGLIFGVARVNAALVLLVELAQAGRHFAGAGARRGHDDNGAGGLNVVVFAVAVVRDDEGDVRGVVRDGIVLVDAYAKVLQLMLEELRRVLAAVLGDDDTADIEPDGAERVNQAHDVHVVGDAEVAAALVELDMLGADGDDDLRLIFYLQQHFHLAVRLEAGEHARGVVVVEELAAELQIELAAELVDALENFLRLQLKIFLIVKSDLCHILPLFLCSNARVVRKNSNTRP